MTGAAFLSANLPAQMIPKTKKTEEWKKDTMNALAAAGRLQIQSNLRLLENYEMVRGKFIMGHYFENDGQADMLAQLTREFDIPKYLRHYDIISQVINILSGEWQQHPDNYAVRGFDEQTVGEYLRTQTTMLFKHVQEEINIGIDKKLLQMGLDPHKEQFSSDEEKQQYEQQLDQSRKELTPKEIQTYMDMSWQDTAEIWGDYQLKQDKQKFNLPELEKEEFEDMCIADRCFRHFYLKPGGYGQETWNTINTFFHKSPEIKEVENGDYVGRQYYLTPSAVIDRKGYVMTEKQILQMEVEDKYNRKKSAFKNGVSPEGIPHGSVMPFADHPAHKMMMETIGFDPLNPIPQMDANFWSDSATGSYTINARGMIRITEAYWKSKQRLGLYTYFDTETKMETHLQVNEDFVVPEGVVEITDETDVYDVNTVVWTWVNQVWQGTLLEGGHLEAPIYLDIKPCEFQFKGDQNIYEVKLPVCGQIFHNKNAESQSIVDLMKSDQIGHNVAMNQAYQIMQREVGRFMLFDVNILPAWKDWAGERGFEKLMEIGKSLGAVPVDTSPKRTKGANNGNQFPKMIDLDETARILSRLNVANHFEMAGRRRVGISDQRLGDISASESATGVNSAKAQSYTQTQSLFTDFSNYKRRTLRMNLDIAQYVQSQEKDITVMYTKSDMSRGFHKINGTRLLLADLHIYIVDSQEETRKLEALRQLFMNNPNSQASEEDLATVVTSNSVAEIKTRLKKSTRRREEVEQQQQAMEQKRDDLMKQIADEKLAWEKEKFYDEMDNKKEVAYIQTFGHQMDNMKDANADGSADLLEYGKLATTTELNNSKIAIEREKLQQKREDSISSKEIELKKLNVQLEGFKSKERIEKTKLKNPVAGERKKAKA